MTATIPSPVPQSVTIDGESFSLVAFYYPGKNTPWDDIYGAPFMGNYWKCPVTINPPNEPAGTFHTAEAAFQATKWWQDAGIRQQFENTPDGVSAWNKHKDVGPQTNHDWAGFGEIGAMDAVLKSKFKDQTLASLLVATGDAYLLEHSDRYYENAGFWNDNFDGSGQNQLGLALMRLRSVLNSGSPVPDYPEAGKFTPHVLGQT